MNDTITGTRVTVETTLYEDPDGKFAVETLTKKNNGDIIENERREYDASGNLTSRSAVIGKVLGER